MWQALASIWLALQMPDDVYDWEDDLSRGGAWAVALTGGVAPGTVEVDSDLRQRVFGSGILPRMLERGRWHFENASRIATSLGAPALAAWGASNEQRIAQQIEGETGAPGFAQRQHALIAWAREILG
jgi:hypothetical protein